MNTRYPGESNTKQNNMSKKMRKGRSLSAETLTYIKGTGGVVSSHEKDESTRPYTFIDGKRRNCACAVGYCWSTLHRGYISEKQLKQHGCLNKHCPALQKFLHPYWKKRDNKQFNRKMRELLINLEMKQQSVSTSVNKVEV